MSSESLINVCLVKVGTAYSADYVNRMVVMLARHLKIPHEVTCITDDPSGIFPGVVCVKPRLIVPNGAPLYWHKMDLFRPGMFPGGERTLYMDLDQILLGDITPMVEKSGQFACYADHISWCGSRLGSAMMIYYPAAMWHVFQAFDNEHPSVYRLRGGDQAYINQFMDEDEIDFIDTRFPAGTIASYKLDLAGMPPLPHTKIVNFHGKPKPHEELVHQAWIRKNWG